MRVPLSENQEPGVGQTVRQVLEHRQALPDLLIRPLIAENTDQRRAGLKPQLLAIGRRIDRAEPTP